MFAPFWMAGIKFLGMMDWAIFDESNLFNPHPATADPKYLIAGPAIPFKRLNIWINFTQHMERE